MAVPKFIQDGKGSWRGRSKLNLPWLPADKQVTESDSSLHIDCDRQAAYAKVEYTWAHEGKPQDGSMLLCGSDKTDKVDIGWVDSWHQNTAVLHLVGNVSKDESLKTKGTYSAGGQDWGWTIALSIADSKLTLKMENVLPSGEAQWAVEATYERH